MPNTGTFPHKPHLRIEVHPLVYAARIAVNEANLCD